MTELLSLAEAWACILDHATALDAEPVAVASAAGRVLAEDATAVVDLPPFASSAMDGFAVRSTDTPGRLPVVARIAAGAPARRALAADEAMGIATGGAVPDGADSVVPIEHVVERDNDIEIPATVARGDNVRPQGGDVRAGEVVVPAGIRIGPARIGALAAAGISHVVCARRPRVAVVATGSELRAPGEQLDPGQVYEANGTMLAAALEAVGAEVEQLPVVADDEDAHRTAIEHALRFDVVVTSGGVSVGPHDLVRRVERDLGVEERFWRVAVKPGKPVSFGVRGRTLVFGLPGNPVSSLVGFTLFVRPAVLALQGAADVGPEYESARLASPVRRNAARDEFLRARRSQEEDGTVVAPIGGQESHMIVRAAGADALVFVPRGDGELAAGESVRYLRLG